MAKIRCPGCGKSEDIDLQGRFLATCDECSQQFAVYIVGRKAMASTSIVCPQCGSTQESILNGSENLLIICNICGHSFIV